MSVITSLVSYWSLEEASGTRNDSHGTSHLTDNNTVGSATGLVGTAADFEQDNSEYLSIADNVGLSTGDIDFSFAGWVYLETNVGFPVLFSKGPAGVNREYVFYLAFGVPQWEATGTIAWGSSLSNGAWYHVVVWHTATTGSPANQLGIVINNGTPVTGSTTGSGLDGSDDFQLGAANSQSLYWDGLVDEFGFWKKVLTPTEITWLYNSGAGRSYADIVAEAGGGGGSPRYLLVKN